MNVTGMAGYLSGLMNRPVAPDTVLVLSSAQRARLQGWLRQNGVQIDGARLRGNFTVESLHVDGGSEQGAPPAAAGEQVARERVVPMPVGHGLTVGIDIQHVDELLRAANLNDFKADPALVQMFTLRELSYAQSSKTPAETLAGIFAAKEAVRKCMGGRDVSSEQFRALEILPDGDGRPRVDGFEISIAHSGGFAVAVSCGRESKSGEQADSAPGLSGTDELPAGQPAAGGGRIEMYRRLLWVAGALIVLQSALVGVLLIVR